MDKLLENSAWPLALVVIVIVFFCLFRSSISNLLGRIRGVSYGNKTLDMAGSQTTGEKQKQVEGPVGAVPDAVPASHMMPPSNEFYAPMEQELRTELAQSKLSPDIEKAWLIRAVVTSRTQRGHEIIYRLVLGSQINLMLLANTPNPPTAEKAREIFDQAKSSFPSMYENFEFEAWRQFPIRTGLLRMEVTAAGVTVFRITPAGRDFLHYLVDNSLTEGKPG
jgi:hypothetical protein